MLTSSLNSLYWVLIRYESEGEGKEAYWITVSLSLTILKKRLGGCASL